MPMPMVDTEARTLEAVRALPMQYRTGEIALVPRAADAAEDAPNIYELSVSSEAEVKRWFGLEVLSHEKDAVDMSRIGSGGAAVLVDHWGDQVGVVDEAWIDTKERKLRVKIRFSRNARAQEIERDVIDGIRKNVSVGYFVHEAEVAEKRETVSVWKVTRWEPCEVSIVGVPADSTVGFGRSQKAGAEFPVVIKDGTAVKEDAMLLNRRHFDGGAGGGGTAAATPAAPSGGTATVDTTAEEKRATAIREMCSANKMDERAAEFILSVLTPEQVAARIVEATKTRGGLAPSAERVIAGMPARDMARYSYHRAIRLAAGVRARTTQVPADADPEARAFSKVKFDGIEAEVHEELYRNLPDGADYNGGVLVPMSRATLTSITATKATELVPQTAGTLIEMLRARAMVIASGATVLTGLTGQVAFPRQTSGATVTWVLENPGTDVGDGEPAFGLATLVPKTLMGNVPFTRQLLAQASIDIEAMVRNELAIAHGLAIDRACIHGLGANGEPVGIYKAQSVNAKDFVSSFANVTIDNLLEMVALIADKNADLGTMGWLTTPLLAAKLRAILEISAGGVSNTMWQGNLREGTMLGYTARTTTQCSKVMTGSEATGGAAHALLFGNWADLLIALFGAMEVTADPFSRKKRAIVEVTTYQMADTLLRHGESMTKATNLTLT